MKFRFFLIFINILFVTSTSNAKSSAELPLVHLTRNALGVYELGGGFETKAPKQIVWDVLTDYNHIGDFVSIVKKSEVKERVQGSIIVEQTSVSRYFFFFKTVTLLLQINETPTSSIIFTDMNQEDFSIYEGRWTLEEMENGGVRVKYKLLAKINFFAPSFIAQSVFKKNAQLNFSEVRMEIEKRAVDSTH